VGLIVIIIAAILLAPVVAGLIGWVVGKLFDVLAWAFGVGGSEDEDED
jgi:L-cystine uptake protein TcyP (sodium:dicarboxylate symporter family)